MGRVSSVSKQYYSQSDVASDYDKERFTSRAGKMFDAVEKSIIMSALNRNTITARVLDAGTGTGRFAIEFGKMGLETAACDYSPAMLDILRAKVRALGLQERVSITRQDVCRLSYEDNQFDFICCMRVLVNLDTRENISKAVQELTRVCRPNGMIVFDIVNPRSLAYLGPQKESMMTVRDTVALINSLTAVRIEQHIGRRLLTQSLFEKAPRVFLGAIDAFDTKLSARFPQFCVRTYFILRKHAGGR